MVPRVRGVLVGPLGEGQRDVSTEQHGGMGDNSVIGPTLAFFGKIEKRLCHLEKHLDVPSALIGRDDLLVTQGDIGGQRGQPLFGAPVPDEYDFCRDRDSLVIFNDLDHDRSENLCAASSLADLPVNGRQREIFPLVAISNVRLRICMCLLLVRRGMNLAAANICNDILNGHFVSDINRYLPQTFD
jgi:hypothetical protein